MSDEHAHNDGAHEIDKMPSGRLFNILFILGSLTLVLCIGVIQLFNEQVRNIEKDRVSGGYASQQEYMAEMNAVAEGYGEYEIVKPGGEDKPDDVTTRYYIPVDKAQQQVIDNPAVLSGKTPARGWAGTGTGKKIEEWGGMPGPTDAPPGEKPAVEKRGDAKDAAKLAEPRDHRFALAVNGEDLVLLGEVPDEATKAAIEAGAKKTHFGDKVRNKLKVTGAPGKPGFEPAYERGLEMVDLMTTGAVKWTGGKLSAEGFIAAADQAKLDALAKAEGTPMGPIELATTEDADACDKSLARALRRPIVFDGEGEQPGATISEKSAKMLDKVAAIAQKCPGRIMVEGHTDKGGEPDANKKLSLERARAVSAALQERGLERARVRAMGFGGERPLEEGAPEKNERIIIRVAR